MLFNFIMLFFKHSLLFLCAITALSSCSNMKYQRQRTLSGAHKFGWQVDNYDKLSDRLNYYIATAEYNELICFETQDGKPLCISVEERLPGILDTTDEPYVFVSIHEANQYGELTITDIASLREAIKQ